MIPEPFVTFTPSALFGRVVTLPVLTRSRVRRSATAIRIVASSPWSLLRVPSVQMRRVLSIALALLFSLGPLAATFRASDDTRLPACCRRHGAHHCAMSDDAMARGIEGNAASKPSFAAPSHCPLYPHGTPAPSSSQALTAVQAHASSFLVAAYRPIEPQRAPANRPISNLSVRGPPSRSFC